MAFLKIIPKKQAQKPLQTLYQDIENTFSFIPNAFLVSSNNYEITNWFWQGLKTIMLKESSIPRQLKESIALVVSKNNSCSYCVGAHTLALKSIGFDVKKIEELNQNYKTAAIPEKEKAIFDFAIKITNESYKITEKDHDLLKSKYEMTEQQILEIISVASMFNFINRFVDSLGAELEKF